MNENDREGNTEAVKTGDNHSNDFRCKDTKLFNLRQEELLLIS